MKVIGIYDNGGKTLDRYTVYFDTKESEHLYSCIGMSERPFHPQGFCQHSSGQLGKHNGKCIKFEELPEDCQKVVKAELSI